MVYVALSRARNLEGLKVIRLARNMAQGVNKEVEEFLRLHFDECGQKKPVPGLKRLEGPPDAWKQWRTQAIRAFRDYGAMQSFPAPPHSPCAKMECRTAARVLKACQCNIEDAFTRMDLTKAERSRWHPDKFSRVPQENREAFQAMAAEVFVVVDAMWQERGKKK